MTQAIYQGFILSRQQYAADKYSRHSGITLCYWLSSDHGPLKVLVPNQQAVFFIPLKQQVVAEQLLAAQNITAEFKDVSMKHFSGEQCIACYFSNTHALYQARQLFESQPFDNQITVYEGDVRHSDRFLMERFIRGAVWVTGDITQQAGYIQIDNAQLKAAKPYIPQLKTVSLDIECSGEGVLYSVGLVGQGIDCVIMIGEPVLESVHNKQTIYWCHDEIDLLTKLQQLLHDVDPDIIIGWNVIEFDFSVLNRRAEALGVKLLLGRGHGQLQIREGHFTRLTLPGRCVIDGIDTLKNATYHFDSFSLANVSHKVLGEKKLIQIDNRLSEIVRQFNEDKLSLAAYNRQDCILVKRIFEQLNLIEFAIVRTQLTGLELERMGGSVAAFTNLYLPLLHRSGYVAPNLGDHGLSFESPGGFVMESIPGLYKNVIVLDFKSLYPSIMQTFCIDPLGLIRGLAEPVNAIPGFKDAFFSRTEHHLPNLIKTLASSRQHAKNTEQPMLSQAIKIIMNSLYGVLGSKGCRFYDPRLSSSITLRGHEIMQTTRQWIEELGYTVIYGDTDSTFVSLPDELDASACEVIAKQLAITINEKWQHTIKQRFATPSYLEIEFETLYSPFFMPTIRGKTTGSKKRYVGQVDTKGKKELIFKGMETARSDWTELAHEFQTELFATLFLDNFNVEMLTPIIESYITRLYAGEFDSKLVYRKRLGQHLIDYQKNVPPQVQAIKKYQSVYPDFVINKGQVVEYVYTKSGAELYLQQITPSDYQFDYSVYVEKQLKPIAQMILHPLNHDFITDSEAQLSLL
ncbi:DNA polymerase II [Pseudoalteromonas sp. KAN5]|uniref:DNA polymerase II n=1 Tax=Pseudoalteromonas sp. KAN5 TaxID=2916633 RepID=UPI001FCCAE10|nr:DNA polymerase II [Pseudoalteromonas sp. KAN5]BDF93943.1 DNA polymerase [Pseudoalteromonas sp. KAN5]